MMQQANGQSHDHNSHSHLVRGWRVRGKTLNPFAGSMEWEEEVAITLISQFAGYRVSVSFGKYKDHPEWTRVRSTNWRCEHEPSGIWETEEARRFYTALKTAGFVKELSQ